MEIYLDVLMLLNFLVDLLLMVGTNRLSGHPPGARKALPAALLGGIYGGVCLLPGLAFLGGFFWRCVFWGLMSFLAFGWDLGRGFLFVLLSMALGGMVSLLNRGGFMALVLSAGAIAGLCILGFRQKVGARRFVPVTISCGGKTAFVTALVDTGNTLRDPISGKPVLVVDETVAGKLSELTQAQLRDPITTLAQCPGPGYRLIPFNAVGSPGGMLLGLRPDSLRVDGREAEYIIAFAPQRLGSGRYQALAGGVL